MSYGNYDGYTLIQLAQYMSTIANGVTGCAHTLLKNRNESQWSTCAVEYTTKPQVQLTIPASKADSDVVKQGLYQVVRSNRYVTGMLASVNHQYLVRQGLPKPTTSRTQQLR